MPSGVSKASGLHDLCALMSKSMKNTVVIGDYYNDLEIMREAGYAVAVANAPAGQGSRRPCDDLHLRRGRSGGVSVQPD